MPYAHIASSAYANVTTSSIDTTGADLIVVALSFTGASSPTVSDSKSNTWSYLTPSTDTGAPRVILAYCRGGTVGTGHTFTHSAGDVNSPIRAMSFSGSSASPADQQNKNTTAGTSYPAGSITPTENDCLVVAAFNTNGSSISASPSGYTIPAGNTTQDSSGYLIQTTAAATNPTWTTAGFTSGGVVVASFKASAGGGGGPFPHYGRRIHQGGMLRC